MGLGRLSAYGQKIISLLSRWGGQKTPRAGASAPICVSGNSSTECSAVPVLQKTLGPAKSAFAFREGSKAPVISEPKKEDSFCFFPPAGQISSLRLVKRGAISRARGASDSFSAVPPSWLPRSELFSLSGFQLASECLLRIAKRDPRWKDEFIWQTREEKNR